VFVAITGVLIAAAAAAYWFRTRRGAAHAPRARETRPRTEFSSAEIRLSRDACESARALKGRRFLAKEAPALPLPHCSAPRCSCSFVKLPDRRTDDRRLEHEGLIASMFLTTNRRQKRGRRRAERASEER